MTLTPIDLGELIDNWTASGAVSVVETASAVTVSRLSADLAAQLITVVEQLAWSCEVHDQAGEITNINHVEEDFGPFVATVLKEVDGVGRRILTQKGMVQAFAEKAEGGIWQIACCRWSFTTGAISVSPWGSGDIFSPAAPTKSPLDLVRETNESRLVPTDIRKWILRGPLSDLAWRDKAFQTFANTSAPALVRSLASEVIGSNTVIFSGPPRFSSNFNDATLIDEMGLEGYRSLQAAASWVYEDTASAEQRHALFAAEFARSITRKESLGRAFFEAGKDILDGARLAFQLSQSDLSREAIKAQADLRKAIADDTAKAADGTRSLAASIAVAIATGITLMSARSTGTAEPWVLALVAIIVAGYLVTVALSGWAYLRLQNQLRAQWRRRFYRFVPADDYHAMVTKPAKSAEIPYHVVAVISLIVAALLVWASWDIWKADRIKTEPVKADHLSTQGNSANKS